MDSIDGAPPELASAIGREPAAVLLVDLTTRTVVHANPVAEQLAPGLDLPVGLDDWSDAARLRDIAGDRLSDTDHPLSRIARTEPVDGYAVSAARDSELGPQREPLWVIGLPLQGAPMLESHALVVMLPLHSEEATDALLRLGQEQALLRERAVLATGLSFTVADARAPEQPLVWVNPAFTTTTGYTFEDAVGSNCRFLQGERTDAAQVLRIREALDRGEEITVRLLNYRKDGLPFWNELSISPIHGHGGELTHFVGIQTDVTERVAADLAREAAQARLRLMAEATTRLSGTLDFAEARSRLVDLVVPQLADWILVVHVDDQGLINDVSGFHRDEDKRAAVDDLARRLPAILRRQQVEQLLLAGSPVRLLTDLQSETTRAERMAYLADESFLDLSAAIGADSALFVPLPCRRAANDLIIMVRGEQRRAFTPEDVDLAADLGRRAGLILDNARLFSTQQLIAETLQRSLLPDIRPIAGIEVATRYLAGQSGAEVGGDFYELIELSRGCIGLAVGDVVGHDVLAAAAMGHLKGMLRACAFDGEGASPARVLERVDQLIGGLGMPTIATAIYAHLSPSTEGWTLSFSNAGHPPLVVRLPDGDCRLVLPASGDNDVLLGVVPGPRRETELQLPVGAVVVGYTDGLIERRGASIDDGIERLLEVVRAAPDDMEGLCDRLTALAGHNEDDVAVIALRLGGLDPA